MPRSQTPPPATPAAEGPSRRSALRMLGGATGAVLLTGGAAATAPGTAHAATFVPQAGPVPLPIDQSATTDNLTVLLGTSAAHSSDMTVYGATEGRKNFWIQNFVSGAGSLSWQVSVQAGDAYRVYALVNAQPGQQLTVAVSGTSSSRTFTTANASTWQRIDAGTLTLPSGTSTITLTRNTFTNDLYVKSLELVRESAVAARQQRIAAARADTTWFSQGGYGLMFQYGSWGFPDNVGTAKPLHQQAADFHVPTFVKLVQETGAAYVIWSFSWWGYHPDMPVSAIESITGDPSFTADRDLIGEIAAALKAVGIRFLLYYHTGSEESAWWTKQNFPTSFSADGSGDRSTFLAHWKSVVTEIGTALGRDLDGFFFDDGIIYYPAPFESLQQAARAGNPDRLVSWNSWALPRLTDFQDVYFGEASQGQSQTGSAGAGGNGVFTSGPYQGLLQHGMFTMDGDWGVHTQGGDKITTLSSVTSSAAIGWATSAASRNVPISFDLMMYEDGAVADSDLRILNDVRQAVHGSPAAVPTGTTVVNDTDPAIGYSGAWTHAAGRGSGDHGDDVHWTTANGASFTYTFTGTGIDVIGPRSSSSRNFTVTVDGTLIGTFSQYAASGYQAQAVLYSARHLAPGTHTIKVTKVDGTYLQLDALRVVPTPRTLNDTDPAIGYGGAWTHAAGRGVGDHGDDVHWTTANGATATVTFTGTGIDVLGPMEPSDGTATVRLDGTQVATIKATHNGAYSPQQHYWGIRNLTPGTHTVQLTKTGGTYFQLDAVKIWP
ncbi:hypothetical protein [Streptomyces formicae]|uniref:Alpha-L-fucosidase n=1 Tax=Streptomyces formicae TaxID=1616117 RepID=A0ABY3WMI7_9ACTN|nr:hypothetical protein [Streptomyces formicae]UNM12791.1 hypothetical protein J4032_15810 [Streptomyces formicae]